MTRSSLGFRLGFVEVTILLGSAQCKISSINVVLAGDAGGVEEGIWVPFP